MDPAVKAVSGSIALVLGAVVAIAAASTGDSGTVTQIRVTVPAGAHSLSVYQGPAPSGWHQCFALNGDAGVRTPSLLADPGQREWNFLAYADTGCPAGEPFAASRNVTAPTDLAAWSVELRGSGGVGDP